MQDVFGRVAAQSKKLPALVPAMLNFVRSDLGPWLATQGGGEGEGRRQLDEVMRRVRQAERVLAAAAGGKARASPSIREEEGEESESESG